MLFMMMIFANGLVLSVLYFGGSLVIDQEITIGQLTSYVLYTITLTVGLTSVAGIINQIVSAIGVCEKIFEIMDAPVEIVNGTARYNGQYA
jgi:ATP-binding cassette subfamily B (MDR/TAP) protein 10